MALAPRKKLWSTPGSVIAEAIRLLCISADDIVLDVGAGDGRFIIACAENTSAKRCIGIEIDNDRALEATSLITRKGLGDRVEMIVGNALDYDYNSTGATRIFLYLVPRGLKIIYPILKKLSNSTGKTLHVCTYMSAFPATLATPRSTSRVAATNHPGALWPLYYYEIEPYCSDSKSSCTRDDEGSPCEQGDGGDWDGGWRWGWRWGWYAAILAVGVSVLLGGRLLGRSRLSKS